MKKAWLILIVCLPLTAQPVLTEVDLPEIGYQAEFVSDTAETIIVDLGTTGGPQTWNYSRAVQGITQTFEVLDPGSTTWGSHFPTAEYAYHLTGTEDTMSGDVWQYLEPTSTKFNLLGEVYVIDTTTLLHDYNPDRIQSVFPLQMGARWNDSYHVQDTLYMGLIILNWQGRSSSEVDAWGTVILPEDTFEALRFITYDTTLTTLTFMDSVIEADTSLTIGYTWVAADVGPVMMISSLNWERNPDFDTAGSYVPLVSNNLQPAVVETRKPAPCEIRIRDGKISFYTSQTEHVELELYDASGRRIASLYRGILSGGEHGLSIPTSLARGAYFVLLKTPTQSMTAKFVALD